MRKKVLVVDDNPVDAKHISFMLESAGYSVRIEHDGFAGLNELQSKRYDLVVLDISMPYMNGFTALKAIRSSADLKELPVIVLTGQQDRDDAERALVFGVSDFIVKPVPEDDFAARIERALLGGTLR